MPFHRPVSRDSEPPYTDEQYVDGIYRGDEAMFTALVRDHIDGMLRFAFSFVGDQDTARDIVQETFARIWHLGKDWTPKGGVSAYLFSAVRNNALKVLRTTRTQERLQDAIREYLDSARLREDPYVDVILARRLSVRFQALTERQRDALRLRYGHGRPISHVAHVLGIDLRAAERLVARALAALRTGMEADIGGTDR